MSILAAALLGHVRRTVIDSRGVVVDLGRRERLFTGAAADADTLSRRVFPFWMEDDIREWTRAAADNPLPMRLDERFVLYFMWKTQATTHTVVDDGR